MLSYCHISEAVSSPSAAKKLPKWSQKMRYIMDR